MEWAVATAGDVDDGHCQGWRKRWEAVGRGITGSSLADFSRTSLTSLRTLLRGSEFGLDGSGSGRRPQRWAEVSRHCGGRWRAGGAHHTTSTLPPNVEDRDTVMREDHHQFGQEMVGQGGGEGAATEGSRKGARDKELSWAVAPLIVLNEVWSSICGVGDAWWEGGDQTVEMHEGVR